MSNKKQNLGKRKSNILRKKTLAMRADNNIENVLFTTKFGVHILILNVINRLNNTETKLPLWRYLFLRTTEKHFLFLGFLRV